MKKPHFFKAKSRIGLINNPFKQEENNIGVEMAPDVILESDFLESLPNYFLSNFHFPAPETISREKFFDTLTESIINFKNLINESLKKREMQIVIGGDHSVSLPSFLALLERVKDVKKVGYIHFDSHGDINLFKDSPSENFHGMYLRPIFDKFDVEKIDLLIPQKVPVGNLLMIGNLDLDKGEFNFINGEKIQTISQTNFENEHEKYIKLFSDFINRFEYLHVSFDGDVLDKTIFPATGIPAEKGFLLSEVMELIDIIVKHKNLSFDVAEFNPRKEGSTGSKKIVQQILRKLT